jgi:hypothetical protein
MMKKKQRFKSNLNTYFKIKGDIGSTECCRYLNDSFIAKESSKYMETFCKLLENNGYIDMVDMWVVGYDFRLVPYGNFYNYDKFNDKYNYFGTFFKI